MIGRNRLYTKKEPDKDAKLFIIFCEGEKTEPAYFKYFNGIASQIKIEVIPHVDGKNSPMGLYNGACASFLRNPTEEGIVQKYDLTSEDEIWFIIDTDSWGDEIDEMRKEVSKQQNWFIAQSNPCFEVWLYFHFKKEIPTFEGIDVAKNWKQHLNTLIGGFNSNKHPIFIQNAIENSKTNFLNLNPFPNIPHTEVFVLAEKILPLIKDAIDKALASNQSDF